MINYDEFRQLKAFARLDGFYLGMLGICCFASYIWALSSPSLGLLPLLIAISAPFYAARRLGLFRDNILDGKISFRRALCYSILEFFYASIIIAAGMFVYLQFMDGGYLLRIFSQELSRPEMKPVLDAYRLTAEQVLSLYSSIRPVDMAFQSVTINLFGGIILSFPIAAIKQRSYATHKTTINNNVEED